MNVLVVTETCFGNTRTVAQAVADALAERPGAGPVALQSVADTPLQIPTGVDLVLVGSPTHNLGMPTPASRRQAETKGAPAAAVGIREWVEGVTADPAARDVRVVTFDTAVKGAFSGSAAKAAAKVLRRRGFTGAERGPRFLVAGTAGPLVDGEVARARAWADGLLG
jgi:flavorubredoxin